MFGLSPLPRSLEASLRDARDDKAAVRVSAMEDLARHAEAEDGRRAADELVRAVTADVSAQVRGAAAVALADAKVSGGVATDALLDAMKDSHLHVRQMALLALGELGPPEDPRVLAALDAALADEAPALRFQALIAVQRLRPEHAEPCLLEGARDADAEVRHVSLRLLEERSTRGDAVEPSDAVLGACRDALDDSVPSVRLVAAVLLGRAGERDGAKVLAEALNGRPSIDAEDEHAAISVAGELAVRDALPGLRRRAWGLFGRHRFAHEAVIALARMGDGRARESILRGLDAWTRDARTLAVVAAGRAGLTEARAALEAMKADGDRAESSALSEALDALGGRVSPGAASRDHS